MITPSLYAVAWFCGLIASFVLIYASFGSWGLTQMFPEGRKWWDLPFRAAALIFYALIIRSAPAFFG